MQYTHTYKCLVCIFIILLCSSTLYHNHNRSQFYISQSYSSSTSQTYVGYIEEAALLERLRSCTAAYTSVINRTRQESQRRYSVRTLRILYFVIHACIMHTCTTLSYMHAHKHMQYSTLVYIIVPTILYMFHSSTNSLAHPIV